MDHALPVSAFVDRDDRLSGRHRLYGPEPKVLVLRRRDESTAGGVQVAQFRVIDFPEEFHIPRRVEGVDEPVQAAAPPRTPPDDPPPPREAAGTPHLEGGALLMRET